MPLVYSYEVEFSVRLATGESKLWSSTQRAYSVLDAVMQGSFLASGTYPGCTDVKLIRVGPVDPPANHADDAALTNLFDFLRTTARSEP